MKKTVIFCWALIFLFCQYSLAQEIEKPAYELSAHVGVVNPLHKEVKAQSKSGIDFGISGGYYFNKSWLIGATADWQNANAKPYLIDNVPSTLTTRTETQGKWKNQFYGVGPKWIVGEGKWQSEWYSYVGYNQTESPTNKTYVSSQNTEFTTFSLDNSKKSGMGVKVGGNALYHLSSHLQLFMGASYLYAANKINYQSKNPEQAIRVNDVGESYFDAGIFNELPYEEKTLNFSNWTWHIGLKYIFDKKETKKPNTVTDTPLEPVNLVLSSHSTSKGIEVDEFEKITFKWKPVGDTKRIKSYRVKIVQLYSPMTHEALTLKEEITDKPQWTYTIPKSIFDGVKYGFFVEGLDGVGNSITPIVSTQLRARSSDCFQMRVTHLEMFCLDSAYDQTSNPPTIHYGGKVTFLNDAHLDPVHCPIGTLPNAIFNSNYSPYLNTEHHGILGISGLIGGLEVNTSNFDWFWNPTDISGSVNIPPGGTQTFNFTFDAYQFLEEINVVGLFKSSLDPNSTDTADSTVVVPDCLCDPCENFEEMSITTNSIAVDPTIHNHHSVLDIDQDFLVSGSNIIGIKAELVYFKEIQPNDFATDPHLFEMDYTGSFPIRHFCQICNAHIEGLGVFQGASQLTSPVVYASNTTSRVLQWNLSPSLNMSAGVNAKIKIGVPKINPLDCCQKTYQFTIRYTFEDANCKKCERLVDYEFTTP